MEQKSAAIRIAPYAIGIFCLILPFIQISCSGEKMMSFTGVQLVTGSEMSNPLTEETEKIPPNGYAVVALIALVAGIAFCFSVARPQSMVAGICGIVSLVAMLLLKTKMDAEIMKEASGFPVSVDYKVGFWALCIASITGALLAFMRAKNERGQQSDAEVQSEGAPSG